MKKITAIIAFSLVAMTAGAQVLSFNVGRKYAGYYVSIKGDTVNGFLRYGDNYESQKRCVFYPNENDNNGVLNFKPEEISSYFVGDRCYRSIHYSGGLLDKPLRFNLVAKDGGITEFTFYDEDGSRNPDGTPKTEDVFFKANDPANPKPVTLQYFGMGFANKMAAFVADDVELSKKVAAKEKGYGMLKLLDIIDEYNKWYANK
jgi:hypothetical protein